MEDGKRSGRSIHQPGDRPGFFERVRERHDYIYKVFLFILSVAAIVYIYPKKAEFEYEFEKGSPWTYEDLIAPFDFSIRKTPEAYEKEKERVSESVLPYYVHQPSVTPKKRRQFEERVLEDWKNCRYSRDTVDFSLQRFLGKDPKVKDSLARKRHVQVGKQVLDSIFERGLASLLERHEPKGDEPFRINHVKGHVAEEVPADSLFDYQSASAYAEKQLQKFPDIDREFLLDHIENVLAYNVRFDKKKTERAVQERLERVSRSRGKVEKDELIISKGDPVNQEKYRKLRSLKNAYEEQVGGNKDPMTIIVGQSIMVGLCMLSLFFFLSLFRKDALEKNTKLVFILLLIVSMTLLTKAVVDTDILSSLLIPVCVIPIIVRAFYDIRTAIFIHFITVLIISFLVPDRYEFAFIQVIAGFVVIFSIVNMRKRAQFFNSAGVVFLIYAVAFFGIASMRSGSLSEIEMNSFAWLGGSAMLTLFAYPLIYFFEKLFGFLSEISLMELSDTNSSLLRELATQAPGTFQHSLQVADLCEEVVREIGGDTLLVRAGALYHDIGKMDEPMYFIENQTTGMDPHRDLDPEESAQVIIGHVTGGVAKAKHRRLPDTLIDFIRTHHGTTRVQVFFHEYLRNFGLEENEVDDSNFRYPGPLPYSKETAVLMLADSVEASSKSLKDYDADSIDELVERIIEARVQEGQLINAPITLRDITRIKKILKRKLMNIYHVRIEYPQ